MPDSTNIHATREAIEATAKTVIDAIIHVHSVLGPGLLETTYQACLAHELTSRGLHVATECLLPIEYEGIVIDNGFRADMIVNDHLLIENKLVRTLNEVHKAQVITYLKVSGYRLGLLVNWNVKLAKDGIKRIAMNLK